MKYILCLIDKNLVKGVHAIKHNFYTQHSKGSLNRIKSIPTTKLFKQFKKENQKQNV